MEKKAARTASIWYPLAVIFSVGVLGAGIYILLQQPNNAANYLLLAAGCVCVVIVAVSHAILSALGDRRNAAPEELLLPLTERLDQLSILLNLISEQQLLSDRARSIAYREKDREALRRAVHEDMGRQDWDAALSLVDDMERAFGNRAEAQKLRKEINDRRDDLSRRHISEVVATIDKLTRAEQWNGAIREADKLIQSFPDNEQVRNLPHEIDSRRQAVKKQLMQAWHEAVARHDNDNSIDILRQLDPYLTPSEAEAMQDSVRAVFKEKLNNLGAQFAAAFKADRIADAIRVGEQIIKEFPNSGIAQEIREKMPSLRKRAEPTAASA